MGESAAKAKSSLDVSDLLNLGDIFSAATVSGIEYALGDKPSYYKAVKAVIISSVSRVITSNFTNVSSLGGNITDPITKDAFVVALINGLVAAGMQKSVARCVAVGVAGDVLSDRVLDMLGMDSKKSLFSNNAATPPPAAAA
jgi:hypothetical protein